MKLYNLFVATFFVLVNISVGVPVDEKSEIRKEIYSSHDDNLEKLKTNGLDYLAKDLDQLYEIGYEMVSKFWDFYEDNKELMDGLEYAKDDVMWCLRNNLNDAINNHKSVVEELTETLKQAPKNPPCYVELTSYFEDVKLPSRERLSNQETFETAITFFSETEETLIKLDKMTTEVPDEMKNFLESAVNNYVQKMVDNVDSKTEKEEVERQSADSIHTFKERADLYVEHLREKRVMNQNVLTETIEKYKEIRDTCSDMSRSLFSATAMMQSFTLSELTTVDKYSGAKFYIIDDENNKKLVDCEDHVPYYGARPTENVISFNMNNQEVTFVVTGTDENGRRYKRTYSNDNVYGDECTVHEIIQYDNKVLDRKYFIKFEET